MVFGSIGSFDYYQVPGMHYYGPTVRTDRSDRSRLTVDHLLIVPHNMPL